MIKAILASATPERDDRLYPGDVAQFSDGGGLGLAHGAAGVLYALAAVGAERHDEGERWLLDHTAPAPTGTPLGLYDGLAGVAHTLDLLGHRQRASTWSTASCANAGSICPRTSRAAWPASAWCWGDWPPRPASRNCTSGPPRPPTSSYVASPNRRRPRPGDGPG